MAIGPLLTLELATIDGRPVAFDHDKGDELHGEVDGIVRAYLEAHLSRGVEADVLEDIEADCVERICDQFAEGS